MRKVVFLLVCTSSLMFSQHAIPFASSNNIIELALANSSLIQAENVSVEVAQKPAWLALLNSQVQFQKLNAHESGIASFTFSVDISAPINKPDQITFTVSNLSGEQWTKVISLQVSPPEKFELFQNYPNPFNPSTTISYQLPKAGNVNIKIYDITGREVATLFEGFSEAGYHQKEWSASNVASGMYIYQLTLSNEQGKKEHYRKKMLLMK